jgi:hypothetical protein
VKVPFLATEICINEKKKIENKTLSLIDFSQRAERERPQRKK